MKVNYERGSLVIAWIYIVVHSYSIIEISRNLNNISFNDISNSLTVFTETITTNEITKEIIDNSKLNPLIFKDASSLKSFLYVVYFIIFLEYVICIQSILSSAFLIYCVQKKKRKKSKIFIFCEISNIIILFVDNFIFAIIFNVLDNNDLFSIVFVVIVIAIPLRSFCVLFVYGYYKNNNKEEDEKEVWPSYESSKENTIY